MRRLRACFRAFESAGPTILVLPEALRSLLVWVSSSPTATSSSSIHIQNSLAYSSRDPPPQCAGRWHSDEAPLVLPPTRSSRIPARRPRY
ncbi:hypothetical protein K523DRAFT_70828 [Schizophyllum commune Tattone D]|nr:hypothetical protein K523DRAFT_70828 [Schizophyllum commune Tattone D]